MKTISKLLIFSILIVLMSASCTKRDENFVPDDLQINDFVWKGMNQYYLYQNDVQNLRDDRFANQNDLNNFLKNYVDPSTLFSNLKVDATTDKYSTIFSDYSVLQGLLSGNTKNNGVVYGLKFKTGSTTDLFGWIKYIIPNSDAAAKNLSRGQIFYAINGISLTVDNYKALLANDLYTMNFANFAAGAITPNGQSVGLVKSTLAENPVAISNTFTIGAKKIGYLMYNAFYSNYESQLNTAITQLQTKNITHLIVDLRYNSGGSIATATRLASMITGQFTGQLFARQQWNAKMQSYWLQNNPNQITNNFVSTYNGGLDLTNLNLSKIYFITSKSTASASEMVINGLKPYIQVVQIGDVTTGKNVGSASLYDSANFSGFNVNPNHRYAMQPIVLKISNSAGFGDYQNGLAPDVSQVENIGNLGVLGTATEPLLQTALNYVAVNGRMAQQQPSIIFEQFKDSKDLIPFQTDMYLEINR